MATLDRTDRTHITFDVPNERVIVIPRLLPLPQRDDFFEIDGESHVVSSVTVGVDSKTGDITLYIRLRD